MTRRDSATIELANSHLQLRVDAHRGAGWLGLRVNRHGQWIAVLPEPESSDLAASSFLMIPYSNRIAGGLFRFGGQLHRLANGDNHAIHGDVRKRPWTILDERPSGVTLRFDSREHIDVNWPWAFSAEVAFELVGSTLESRLCLRNLSDTAMPAGFGFHPYFLRSLSPNGEHARVQFSAAGVYPDSLDTRIPSGPAVPPTPAQDFSTEKALDPHVFHDFCAYGYDGGGLIVWPDEGIRIAFRTSPELGHLVFYNPPKPYFAMEPVSNANNGVNLFENGDATSGVRVLEPGHALGATFTLVVSVVS